MVKRKDKSVMREFKMLYYVTQPGIAISIAAYENMKFTMQMTLTERYQQIWLPWVLFEIVDK